MGVKVGIKTAHLGCSTRVFHFGRQQPKKIISTVFNLSQTPWLILLAGNLLSCIASSNSSLGHLSAASTALEGLQLMQHYFDQRVTLLQTSVNHLKRDCKWRLDCHLSMCLSYSWLNRVNFKLEITSGQNELWNKWWQTILLHWLATEWVMTEEGGTEKKVADLKKKKSNVSKDIKPWDKRMNLSQIHCHLSGGNVGVGEGWLWGDIGAV